VAINYHDQIFHLQEMEAEVAEKQKRFHHKIKTDFYDNPENKDQELPPLPDMPQKLKINSYLLIKLCLFWRKRKKSSFKR
jgi:hypothetical protein